MASPIRTVTPGLGRQQAIIQSQMQDFAARKEREKKLGTYTDSANDWYKQSLGSMGYNLTNAKGEFVNVYGEAAPTMQALQQEEILKRKKFQEFNQSPFYGSILNKDKTSFIDDTFNVRNEYDPRYQKELYDYATSTQDSPWLRLTKQQIAQEKTSQLGNIAAQADQGMANAREQLALRRGLTTGAGERLAGQGALAQMMGRQGVAGQSAANTLQAQLQEAQQKMAVQQSMPGLEMERARNAQAVQTQNIGNLMAEKQREYALNLDRWKTQEQVNAANTLGNQQMWAAQNTGGIFGQGGFLGTGLKF